MDRTNTSYVRQWLQLLAVWLAVGAVLSWNAWDDYQSIKANEQDRLSSLSRVIDENIQVQISSTNEALNAIRADLFAMSSGGEAWSKTSPRLKILTDVMVGVRTLLVLDASGIVVASSRPELMGGDFHQREFFQASLRDTAPNRLYLAHPFNTHLEDFTTTVSKVVEGASGKMAGIVVAGLDPEYFGTMLDSAIYAPDMRASILDGDGHVLVASPKASLPSGVAAIEGGMFAQHMNSGETSSIMAGHLYSAETTNMVAIRTNRFSSPSLERPVVAALERNWDSIFADWRRDLYTQLAGLLILMLLSAAGLFFSQRRLRAYTELVSSQELARRSSEEKINALAFYDSLTSLPNRTLLFDRLSQALLASSRSGNHGALLMVDVDSFKTLNDTLGHATGDLLLQRFADILTRCVRDGDTVARSGGDEFSIVLNGLNLLEAEAATDAEVVAEKVLKSLDQTYELENFSHRCSASIGITLFKGENASVESLMKQVELAMYKAKDAGRNTMRFFDPDMESAVVSRVKREAELRVALQNSELVLHYQAQVVGDGRVTGAEVLVRWLHPEHGIVPPAEFIPLAEETGLILELGRWVLKSACTRLAIWATQAKLEKLTLAVNVSAQEFRSPDFVKTTLAILDETGANPNRLKLELTESLLVDNLEDIVAKMYILKSKGIGFSLDDFGTGYSSLSYLKRLPLDQLKIDQSFVCDVLSDPNDAAIAKTIVALGQSLGLGVIAEGVETREQQQFLATAGCHFYQGYFFGRPLGVDDFQAVIQET